MKTRHAAQSAPARRSLGEGGFFNLRTLTGLIPVAALPFLAFFAAANPPTRVESVRAGGVTRKTVMRVTPQGVIRSTHVGNSKARPIAAPRIAERRISGPLGTTLWDYDDPNAIADGVSIDANNVWGAWLL